MKNVSKKITKAMAPAVATYFKMRLRLNALDSAKVLRLVAEAPGCDVALGLTRSRMGSSSSLSIDNSRPSVGRHDLPTISNQSLQQYCVSSSNIQINVHTRINNYSKLAISRKSDAYPSARRLM